MRSELKLTSCGYLSLVEMPSNEQLKKYYEDKYFQNEEGSYAHEYTNEEKIYFENRAKVAEHIIGGKNNNCNILLDVGTGEGFFSKYFHDSGWKIEMIDYSKYGIKLQNPTLLPYLEQGDIFDLLEENFFLKKEYDLINLSNVLEHVLEPDKLLFNIKNLLKEDGVARITVPNDFSSFQKYLLEKGYTIDNWFTPPEHLHYFTNDSLSCLVKSQGFSVIKCLNEFPIEIFMVNHSSNYHDNDKGKDAHNARVEIDNFLFKEGLEKYIAYYEACANINFGRQIVVYIKKNKGHNNENK